jgi:hypothetical protein
MKSDYMKRNDKNQNQFALLYNCQFYKHSLPYFIGDVI